MSKIRLLSTPDGFVIDSMELTNIIEKKIKKCYKDREPQVEGIVAKYIQREINHYLIYNSTIQSLIEQHKSDTTVTITELVNNIIKNICSDPYYHKLAFEYLEVVKATGAQAISVNDTLFNNFLREKDQAIQSHLETITNDYNNRISMLVDIENRLTEIQNKNKSNFQTIGFILLAFTGISIYNFFK